MKFWRHHANFILGYSLLWAGLFLYIPLGPAEATTVDAPVHITQLEIFHLKKNFLNQPPNKIDSTPFKTFMLKLVWPEFSKQLHEVLSKRGILATLLGQHFTKALTKPKTTSLTLDTTHLEWKTYLKSLSLTLPLRTLITQKQGVQSVKTFEDTILEKMIYAYLLKQKRNKTFLKAFSSSESLLKEWDASGGKNQERRGPAAGSRGHPTTSTLFSPKTLKALSKGKRPTPHCKK